MSHGALTSYPPSVEVDACNEPTTTEGSEPGKVYAQNVILEGLKEKSKVEVRGSPLSVASTSIHDSINPHGSITGPPNDNDPLRSLSEKSRCGEETHIKDPGGGSVPKDAASPLSPGLSSVKISLHSMRLSDTGNGGIPASPTDRLLSPTSRRLRKLGKTFADERYNLQEAAGTVQPGFIGDASDHDEYISDVFPLDANFRVLPIVLGCSWPVRREILAENSWKFSVLESSFNFEGVIGSSTDSPVHVAKTTAHALASHFDACTSPVILLTVAQVFEIDGVVRHPAQTESEAVDLLKAASNRVVTLRTAVVATECPHGPQAVEVDECSVEFGPISSDLAARVAKRTFSKGPSGLPVRDPEIKLRCRLISGSEDSVLGMPLEAAQRVVRAVIYCGGNSNNNPKTTSR